MFLIPVSYYVYLVIDPSNIYDADAAVFMMVNVCASRLLMFAEPDVPPCHRGVIAAPSIRYTDAEYAVAAFNTNTVAVKLCPEYIVLFSVVVALPRKFNVQFVVELAL